MDANRVQVNMKKLIIGSFLIILAFFVMSFLMWNFNYIDETITEGEKHGFVIGESMWQAFEKIKTDTKEAGYKAVQVGDGPQDFRIMGVDELQFVRVENYNSWLVMLDSTNEFLNTIRLDFSGGKLLSIRRHKKLFELP